MVLVLGLSCRARIVATPSGGTVEFGDWPTYRPKPYYTVHCVDDPNVAIRLSLMAG
jgi:hypothetical protein